MLDQIHFFYHYYDNLYNSYYVYLNKMQRIHIFYYQLGNTYI